MNSSSSIVSFELFPPKTQQGLDNLKNTVVALNCAHPKYFSVTYGAGGSLQNPTFDAIKMLKQELALEVAPHLSCVGVDKAQIKAMIQNYLAMDINRFVILRGDLPSGHGKFDGDFRYASDLVRYIRQEINAPVTIEVGAYPECHPQAKHMAHDLENFKTKIDAGADCAITQYFYNIDAYCHFVEQCRGMNITVPIIPGIMPITNLEQLMRFSKMCGAEIPQWIVRKLESFGDDKQAILAFGIEVVTKLCERLIEEGAPELHFYTLNRAEPTLSILKNLSLYGESDAAG